MIDIMSAAVGVFCGGCVGFIAGKLFGVNRVAVADMEIIRLRHRVQNLEADLLHAQKERLNLAAKVAIDKPKRDSRGRFLPKKGKK